MSKDKYDLIIVGAGAAGVFTACLLASSGLKILVLEKSAQPLSKLKVSGGGRCNVTHACYDPKELIKAYPRGFKELLGPFYTFGPREMIKWLEDKGVKLKRETDGRMFPVTDNSQTIIDCFMQQLKPETIRFQETVESIEPIKEQGFRIQTKKSVFFTSNLLLATGGTKKAYELASVLGHSIVPPQPSLFTFNIKNFALEPLSGVSVNNVKLTLPEFSLHQQGPILITHWGFSGPAVLKMSAFGARKLAEAQYKTTCMIDWCPSFTETNLKEVFHKKIKQKSKKSLDNESFESFLPKQLWKALLDKHQLPGKKTLLECSKAQIDTLIQALKKDTYQIDGQSRFKQEFVTCGGVNLKEINFKNFESKICPGLFFAGELLDIDGITGGFNFQAAWTGAYMVAQHQAEFLSF